MRAETVNILGPHFASLLSKTIPGLTVRIKMNEVIIIRNKIQSKDP